MKHHDILISASAHSADQPCDAVFGLTASSM